MFKSLDRNRDWGLVILRVVTGLIFLLSGLGKFGVIGANNLQGVEGYFTSLGIPLPGVSALLVATVETLGGLALILGLGTRIAAVLLAITMVVAIVTAKLPEGVNPQIYGLELSLLAGCLALLFLGAGRPALDQRFPALR